MKKSRGQMRSGGSGTREARTGEHKARDDRTEEQMRDKHDRRTEEGRKIEERRKQEWRDERSGEDRAELKRRVPGRTEEEMTGQDKRGRTSEEKTGEEITRNNK